MKKPAWFRVLDLVTLGLGGLVSLGLLVYALIAGVQGPHAKEGLYLLATVGFCFTGVWAKFAYDRKRWLANFTWYPTYGVMINAGGYLLPGPLVIDGLIKKTIEAWLPYHPKAMELLAANVIWVWFDKTLDETPNNLTGRLCNGFAISGAQCVLIDYDSATDDITRTGFAHELGHLIRGNATGQWSQTEHHKFMADHSLS